MSNTIDQRVVEMRFDNRQFESGVSTTMSTLEKLKQKLNLSGASKSLSDLNTAAKGVNMSSLGNAVDTVSAKFSALQVMGVTALANITNSAVNAGKSIIKSLTIDPVKTGFEEYETKMGSIQTILANTEHQGTTMDDVTQALERLNTYADKTIYNFQQMTKNIGTFTAAGVDLETSVRSIQGIANLAAVSGSTSQQASTAMYQLSQALATGTVKLMDWNSVVNAGMGGKVFQNALIRTAAVMDGAAADVEAWQKKNIDAYGSFRDSLTQGEWLTSEVLTRTLEQFTMAAEEGSEEWEAFKKSLRESGYTEAQAEEILKMANTATDAATKVKTFTQLLDTLKESAQSGWAQTWEIIVGDFEEAKAFFTELSDLFGGIIGESADRRNSLFGDALDSNWNKLIKQINEAGIETEQLEESIRRVVGDNELDALIEDYGSIQKAAESGAISSDTLKKAIDGIAGATEQVTISTDKLSRTLWWGKSGEDVTQLQQILQGLGHDLGETGVDGVIGYHTSKAIREFQKAHGIYANGIVGPETIAALKEAAKGIETITDNVSDQSVAVNESIDSWKELVDEIDKTSGRELLLESLMNIIKAIQRPLEAIGEAWRNTFAISPDQLYNAINSIKNFTDSFVMKGLLDIDNWTDLSKALEKTGISSDKFKQSLTDTLKDHKIDPEELIKKYGSLEEAFSKGAIAADIVREALSKLGLSDAFITGGENAEKLRRTFAGLFAVLKVVGTLVGGGFKIAFKIVAEVLKYFNLSILDVAANVGDALVKFQTWFDSLWNISGILDVLVPLVNRAVEAIRKWFEAFKGSQGVQDTITYIKEIIAGIKEWWANLKNAEDLPKTIAEGFVNFLSNIPGIISTIGANLWNAFTSSFSGDPVFDIFGKIIGGLNIAGQTIVEIGKIVLDKLNGVLTAHGFAEISSDAIAGLAQGLKNGAADAWSAVVALATGLIQKVKSILGIHSPSTVFAAIGAFAIAGLILGLTNGSSDALGAIKDVVQPIIDWLKELDLGSIFAGILGLGAVGTTFKLASALENITSPLEGLGDVFEGVGVVLKKSAKPISKVINNTAKVVKSFSKVMNSIAFDIKMNGIKTLAETLLMLVGAIIVLTFFDPAELWNAVGLVTVLALVLAGLAIALDKMTSSSAEIGKGSINIKSLSSGLIGIGAAILLMAFAVKMLGSLDPDQAKQGFLGLAGLVIAIGLVIAAFGLLVKGKTAANMDKFGSTMLKLSVALIVMSYVVKALGELDRGTLIQGIVALVAFAGIIVGLMAATKLIGNGNKVGSIGSALLKMAIAIGIMAFVAKSLGELDRATLIQGGIAMVAFGGIIVGLMAATKLIGDGNNVGSIGGALLKISIAIGIMALVAKALGGLDRAALIQGTIAVAAFGGIIVGLMAATKLIGDSDKVSSIGKSLLAISGAIAIMALVSVMLGMVSWEKLAKGGVAITALAGIIVGLMAATKLIGDSESIDNIGKTMISIAGAIAILAGIAVLLSFVPTKNLIKGTGFVAILALLMAGLIAVTKLAKGCVGNIVALTVMMAVLAGLVYLISKIPAKSAITAAIIIGGLMAVMAGVLAVVSLIGKNAKNAIKGVIALSLMVIPLLAFTFALKQMQGVQTDIKTVIALSILMGALSVMVGLLSSMKISLGSAIKGAIALALVAGALGLLVWGLSSIKNIDTARENAKTLANLALVLVGCVAALSLIGTFLSTGMIPSVLALVVVAAALGALVWALSAIKNVETAKENAKTLANLAIVLTACVAVLSVVGLLVPGVIAGTLALVVIAATLGLLVWALSAIKGTDTAKANAETMIELLNSLTDVVIRLSQVGLAAVAGVAALAILSGLIVAMAGFIVATGALVEYFPQLQEFMNTGIGVLKQLAQGLGEIVSAFLSGLTSELPAIAEDLSAFANAIGPFVDVVSGVGDDMGKGAANLAGGIIAFLAADLIAGIASLAGVSLSDLATDLTDFAKNISGFIEVIGETDAEKLSGIGALCDGIMALTGASFIDSITEFITGSSGLSGFGDSIKDFAEGIKDASESLANITDADVENMKRAATAGMALAELNKAIPAQGGWVDNILGAQELGTFGQSVAAFGKCLVEYSATVSGGSIDAGAIEESATAGQALAKLNTAIPAQGGWADSILGSQELGSFGQSIVAFGQSLVDYSTTISSGTIDANAITASATAAEKLAELNGKLPSQNGLYQAVMGEKDLAGFGTSLVTFGEGLVAYGTAASKITDDTITAITNSGKAVDELVIVMNKVPASDGWGDKILGGKDGQGFGAALVSLSDGIIAYSTAAADIKDATILAIQNSGVAIDELKLVMEKVPTGDSTTKAANLSTAANSLSTVCYTLGSITSAHYSYGGIDTAKAAIEKLSTMLTDIDLTSLSSNMSSLSSPISLAVTNAAKLASLNGYTYAGVARFKNALALLSTVDVDSVVAAFSGKAGEMASAIDSLLTTMTTRLTAGTSNIQGAMATLIGSATSAITSKAGDFSSAGSSLIKNLISGLQSNSSGVRSAAASAASSASSGARSKYSAMRGAGQHLGEGFRLGILDKKQAAYTAGYELGEQGVLGVLAGLKAHSPSRRGIQAGHWLGEGLAIGIDDMGSSVYNSSQQMGETAVRGLSDTVSKVADVISSDMDTQPTIRPVLDLSDVRAGAGTISNLLNGDTYIGARSHTGAITSMMKYRGQNGAESDIVDAINRLRKDISNVGSTTYTIGDITYDDGSNVSGAIKDLVREARLERRR